MNFEREAEGQDQFDELPLTTCCNWPLIMKSKIEGQHFRLGESAVSDDYQKKIDELRHDLQKMNHVLEAVMVDVTQNKNLTLATGHYLEEVARMVKDLEDKCPGAVPKER
ncbi:MAG TPA: hypothetical protein VIE66_05325 [Methylocella sp.]